MLSLIFNLNTDLKFETNYQSEKNIDSIKILIDLSRNRNLDIEKRKVYLAKAYRYTQSEPIDSIRNIYFLKLSFTYYYYFNDSLTFRKINGQAIALSEKIKDSVSLASNLWDLASFYSKNEINDSAFYAYSKAQKIYASLNDKLNSAEMLMNMAIVQSDIKDYTGSEVSTIKAISVLKPLKKYERLYRCYNNLGIVLDELKEHEKALFYHKKALETQEKIKGKNTHRQNTLNNIGVSYELQKKYKQAVNYYQQALKENHLKQNNTKLYAMLKDNLAYSKFKLGDTLSVKNLFYSSLKIRDSINDYLGMAINKLHLAEYYAAIHDTIKAIEFASESNQLAAGTKNNRDVLASLLLLSKLDNQHNFKYARQYIKLNDSLQNQERSIRNKFARIRFETDEFIVENERLTRQKELLFLIFGLVLLLGVLLFIIIAQRNKNKELKFERQQIRSNEEIYNLMIAQQYKLDEGSRQEKKRISQELHDGILGKLFGTRLLLGSLNKKDDKESVLQREKYINELQDIEEDVRNVSHDLNSNSLFAQVGFIKMVDNLLETQSKIKGFKYTTHYDKQIVWNKIDINLKMNLYRIIQEAIQNINKYAKAEFVTVNFMLENDQLLGLKIEDNGIGFDTASKSNGIGLKNIKSRIKNVGGQILIDSELNRGTSIKINVPV